MAMIMQHDVLVFRRRWSLELLESLEPERRIIANLSMSTASSTEESSLKRQVRSPSCKEGSASKRRKLCKKDMISMLPDSILCQIMSYLPTIEAVKTSILSRRWRYTWTSITNLDFRDELLNSKRSFVKFMKRVIILHDHPCIKIFRLQLTRAYSNSKIISWVSAAIKRKVEEIEIDSLAVKNSFRSGIKLPEFLFNCGTLMVLKLMNRIYLEVPNSTVLLNLKVLHLRYLCHMSPDKIQRILSRSPVLEELVIDRYDVPHSSECWDFCVQSSSLKSLKYRVKFGGKFPLPRLYRLRLVVDAPNLEFLELSDYKVYDIDMKNNLSSIVTANFHVKLYSESGSEKYGYQLVRLLRQICDVKFLSLTLYMPLKDDFDANDHYLPCFQNLTQLMVRVRRDEWLILHQIVNCSPNLKVLVISKNYVHMATCEAFFKKRFVPQCLISSLERLEFRGFGDSAKEMQMVRYFQKYAKVLKKMTISPMFLASEIKESELLKKLSMFPMASRTCEIEVSLLQSCNNFFA